MVLLILDYKAISKTISNVTTVKGDTLFYESLTSVLVLVAMTEVGAVPLHRVLLILIIRVWSITSANDVRYGAYQCQVR